MTLGPEAISFWVDTVGIKITSVAFYKFNTASGFNYLWTALVSKAASGIDGWYGETVCFVAADGDIFVGAVVVDIIYGQLRVEYLFVEEKYRRINIGSQLLVKALELGIAKGRTFAYLETLNFQDPEFYEKHGFVLEFSRP